MENQAIYKSAIVNGKILEFAQIRLKERMQKQQGNIEDEISALMKENEKHTQWFAEIVQSKFQFPNGVMKYEEILKKMDNNAMSLEEFLNEKIKEELERKMKEDIDKQVAVKIEEEKIKIQKDADEKIKRILVELDVKNDEKYRLEERNADLMKNLDEQNIAHTAALKSIGEKNINYQAADLLKEQKKNLELQHEMTQLKTQLYDQSQLEKQITENSSIIKTLNDKINTQTQKNFELETKNNSLQDQLFHQQQLESKNAELQKKYDESIQEQINISRENDSLRKQNEELANQLETLKKNDTQIISDHEATIKQLQTELSNKDKDVITALNESLKKAMSGIDKASTATRQSHESQLAAEKANCQQKMMELTKTIVLLKMNLDLKEQQTINYKSTFVPSTTNVIKLTNLNTKRVINLLEKSTLKGGGRKSRLFIKGGKIHAFEYETDDDAIDITDINIFTNAQMDEFEKNIDTLQNEIESLKKELESSKTSASTSITPLCTFVNNMTHGSGASADLNTKLYNELVLTKAHISLNANKFLFEKIANLTNKEIINSLTKANAGLKATNVTNKAANVSTNATNAANIAAGTAKAISTANANVFKSKYGNVMFFQDTNNII